MSHAQTRPARLLVRAAAAALAATAVAVAPLIGPRATAPARPGHLAPVVSTAATVKVIQHNMCGGMCKHGSTTNGMSDLASAITSYAPQVMTFQEVCLSQYSWLQSQFGASYAFAYTRLLGSYSSCGAAPNDEIGQVVAVQKSSLASPVAVDIALGGEAYQVYGDGTPVPQPRRFHAICLDTKLTVLGSGRTVRACSAHLRAFHDAAGINDRARMAQAATLSSDLDAAAARDHKAVIVGGDFNAVPSAQSLSPFYSLSAPSAVGFGTFVEADQDTPSFPDSYCSGEVMCRSGEPTVGTWNESTQTVTPGKLKYDDIFFSETADPSSVSALPVFLPWSDHAFYRGLASIATS